MLPVGRFRRPLLDLLQIGGAECERVAAPGQEKDVLDGAKLEQFRRDGIDAENDEPALRFTDLAAEIAGDLLGRNCFESGLNGGVQGGQVRRGSWHGADQEPRRVVPLRPSLDGGKSSANSCKLSTDSV